MHLEAGAVVEHVALSGVGEVDVRYARSGDEWVAEFTVAAAGVDDLRVVHQLRAPSLAAARRAVPDAAAFLAGLPVAPGPSPR